MASIQKRKNKNGTSHWRAVVRIKGYPTVCNHDTHLDAQITKKFSKTISEQILKGVPT